MGRRIAVFGGAFDPVHMAHLRCAQEAAEDVGLEQVLFLPYSRPPHGKALEAAVEHRLEMLRLATADNPLFGVSDLEARLGGVSYTVDTLQTLREQDPEAEIYFLIGADAFFWLHSWRRPLELFKLANFVVMARPKSPKQELLEYLQTQLDPAFYQGSESWICHPVGKGVHWVPTTLLSISSTKVRRLAGQGRSLRYLVPPQVEDYIRRMNLYPQVSDPK